MGEEPLEVLAAGEDGEVLDRVDGLNREGPAMVGERRLDLRVEPLLLEAG